MKKIGVKAERALELLGEITVLTGETPAEVLTHASELYLKSLEAFKRADAAVAYVRNKIHPQLEPGQLGCVPTKEELSGT